MNPRLVLVTGSGRSGTSSVAGTLKRLGLHVPQPEVPADEKNPRGYYEPMWVTEFHKRVLNPVPVRTIDTRRDPEAARQLKAWWAKVGSDRFKAGAEGVFSYNLFGVSHADYGRIEALQRAYFREIRNIVAESEPVETVAVVNLQLFSLLAEQS